MTAVDTKTDEAPEQLTGPAYTAYTTVWVYKKGVAAAGNQTGFVRVLKTAADAMVAASQAVLANGRNTYPYIEGHAPKPPPVVVSITAFTAANPTVATASSGDVTKLTNGNSVKLVPTAGDSAAQAAILNKLGTVANKTATTFELTGVSLVGKVITGLKATGTVQAPGRSAEEATQPEQVPGAPPNPLPPAPPPIPTPKTAPPRR